MGAWTEEIPSTTEANFDAHEILFVGHLVKRMGVELVVQAMPSIRESIPNALLRIIGDGPLAATLQNLVQELGLSTCVIFEGFVEDTSDLNNLMRGATIAVAPYRLDPGNFSQFADPGKLKMYIGAGLPIITTNVAPFAVELFQSGAATETLDEVESIAAAITQVLGNRGVWTSMRSSSVELGAKYSWRQIFSAHMWLIDFD